MGTMTPPPGFPGPAGPAATPPRSSSGISPWKVAAFALAALAALLWFRRPDYLPSLPLASATAQGAPAGESASPVRCTGSAGCLVVYLAPWCGPCRSSIPGDVALADHIAPKGWETVFVVGMDKEPACLDMTRQIGRPAFLDLDGSWAKAAGVRGVPHFLVTTPSGKIVKRQAGAYLAPPGQVAQLLGIS